LNNYLEITDIINNMFRPQKTLNKTILYQHYNIIQYSTLALPALLYGSENWTIEARDTRRTAATEMI